MEEHTLNTDRLMHLISGDSDGLRAKILLEERVSFQEIRSRFSGFCPAPAPEAGDYSDTVIRLNSRVR
ncbi:MAG: hypothetical protein RQ758_07225 [Methanomicrobiaceae archaeon]|nr:hypothetical protein [Methanomicrobiaceae archaeon]